jgi:hypothetical protein
MVLRQLCPLHVLFPAINTNVIPYVEQKKKVKIMAQGCASLLKNLEATSKFWAPEG